MWEWLKKIVRTGWKRHWRNSSASHEPLSTLRSGTNAEEAAYRFLREQGYRMVARNYRRQFGEIDLIGWDGEFLAFIEVKYRSGSSRGLPVEAVHQKKQRQICRLAREYRIRHKLHDINFRFDIVSIRGNLACPSVELIKGAFHDSIH
jgi:putative endonuclease